MGKLIHKDRKRPNAARTGALLGGAAAGGVVYKNLSDRVKKYSGKKLIKGEKLKGILKTKSPSLRRTLIGAGTIGAAYGGARLGARLLGGKKMKKETDLKKEAISLDSIKQASFAVAGKILKAGLKKGVSETGKSLSTAGKTVGSAGKDAWKALSSGQRLGMGVGAGAVGGALAHKAVS